MMFGVPNIVLALAVAGGAAIGGFFVGVDYEQGNKAEEQLSMLREHNRYIGEQAQRINKLAMELEYERSERKIIFDRYAQDVRRLYSRPVYQQPCLDKDGVSVINRALTGKP